MNILSKTSLDQLRSDNQKTKDVLPGLKHPDFNEVFYAIINAGFQGLESGRIDVDAISDNQQQLQEVVTSIVSLFNCFVMLDQKENGKYYFYIDIYRF